jgi:hypothetical protein
MFRMKSVVGSMYKSAPLPTTNFGCTIGCLRAAGAADDTVAAFAAPSSLSTCTCDRVVVAVRAALRNHLRWNGGRVRLRLSVAHGHVSGLAAALSSAICRLRRACV